MYYCVDVLKIMKCDDDYQYYEWSKKLFDCDFVICDWYMDCLNFFKVYQMVVKNCFLNCWQ